MPALFVFLLKVNIALIVFCLGYSLVLRRLTFYTLNRMYLDIAIIFSSVYPLINLDNFVQKHNIPVKRVIVDWKIPAGNFVSPLIQHTPYWQWATLLFWIGATLFATRLFVQLLSLYKLHKNSHRDNIQNHKVRVVKANISPFSFWQTIYINPDNLDPADLKSVLQHEQVHVQEWHTLDILLTELSAIFYWFNPGIWLIKKAVRENIEFITDRRILQRGMDSKTYQYSLLNISLSATTAAGITNNFNFSTLKKRIIMMNAKRSSNANLTRYAFLVPAVLICLLTVGMSKAELVKKSKIAYRHITASIADLKNTINVNTTVPEKKVTFHSKVSDTVKKAKSINITKLSDGKDASKMLRGEIVVKPAPIDSPIVVVDGNIVNSISQVDPNNILSVSVITKNEKVPNGLIVIQTKANHDILRASPTVNNLATLMKRDSTVLAPPPTTFAFSSKSERNTTNEMNASGSINNKSDNGYASAQNQVVTDTTKTDALTGVLIIIDGKVATRNDLINILKIPAFESLVFNGPDKAMIDKYGDKAKKGILIVTTKKKN